MCAEIPSQEVIIRRTDVKDCWISLYFSRKTEVRMLVDSPQCAWVRSLHCCAHFTEKKFMPKENECLVQ